MRACYLPEPLRSGPGYDLWFPVPLLFSGSEAYSHPDMPVRLRSVKQTHAVSKL